MVALVKVYQKWDVSWGDGTDREMQRRSESDGMEDAL
jgi:hypothetical protein